MSTEIENQNPTEARPRRRHIEGGHPHGGRRHGRGARMMRGDVRNAVIVLLSEAPMHGYQLMTAISERSNGRWTPSPGAIYPTLGLLEDEGLVVITQESGRKVATLTDLGHELAKKQEESGTDPFNDFDEVNPRRDLRSPMRDLIDAVRQVGRTGSAEQVEASSKALIEAKRAIYLILAGEEDSSL